YRPDQSSDAAALRRFLCRPGRLSRDSRQAAAGTDHTRSVPAGRRALAAADGWDGPSGGLRARLPPAADQRPLPQPRHQLHRPPARAARGTNSGPHLPPPGHSLECPRQPRCRRSPGQVAGRALQV
ncbi:uncharacterized protein METZ01_LOCUS373304, partial [marine metagenome]